MVSSILIENVSKSFGENAVLKNVSATFTGGKIYGIVGRNGSGKTVLMKLICGFLPMDAGKITVNGKALSHGAAIPKGIGAIIEAPGFLPQYSGYKNLRFLADIQRKIGRDEIRLAMKQVGLNPDMRKRVGTYSLGMRQRLGLAQAIMEDPPILLLDEPMNGLDEAGIQFVRELLQRLRNHGKLILMASHMKEDLDLLCDEIYRVHEGSLFLQC